jgi:glycerol kinase
MSRTPGILAIDQGTTGSTCLVIDRDGRITGRAYQEFTQYFPQPGWVEHDASEIWEVTRGVAREALQRSRSEGTEVVGIGITNQRETIVLWDRETLEPVSRALVWQDRRTAAICREFREAGHEERVRARTGLLFDPYFSGTKLTWWMRENPALRRVRGAGGGDHRQLAHRPPHSREVPPHRSHQRLPHPPL